MFTFSYKKYFAKLKGEDHKTIGNYDKRIITLFSIAVPETGLWGHRGWALPGSLSSSVDLLCYVPLKVSETAPPFTGLYIGLKTACEVGHFKRCRPIVDVATF